MSTRKTIGGALGAIIVLLVAQILAQLVASLFVLVKIPEGICNIELTHSGECGLFFYIA